MDHHTTWLTLLPGYKALNEMVQRIQPRGLLGSPVVMQHVLAALLTACIVLYMALRTRSALQRAGMNAVVPGPEISVRNLIEATAEALLGQMLKTIGPDARRYFPVLFSLTLFIFFANALGLIPGFMPPTDNWNTTLACGLVSFAYANYHGLRVHGVHHILHLVNPIGGAIGWLFAPLMFPIEVISNLARPISLAIRLAANMVGDHAVLLGFLSLVPILVPLPFMALGVLVSVIQTVVFVLLTMIYLSLATAGGHDTDGEGHAQAVV